MTYGNVADADADRAQQRALLLFLNAWDRALRRDEGGAWCIHGTRGTVHTWGDGKSWVLFVACRSIRHWTATKARLFFCHITQDCDAEGCLRLFGLPTPDQAEVVRDVLGLRKRMEFSPDDLERRRASMTRLVQPKSLASHASQVSDTVGDPERISELEPAKLTALWACERAGDAIPF